MTMPAAVSDDADKQSFWSHVGRQMLRHGFSSLGPVMVSGAHFLAALMFLHGLSITGFGQFSFLLIIVPFCLGITGALLGTPVARALNATGEIGASDLAIYLKSNLVIALLATIFVAALMLASGADRSLAALMGLYGGVMCLRQFGRSIAYAASKPVPAILSDIIYSLIVIAALAFLFFAELLTLHRAGLVLFVAAIAGYIAYGRNHLTRQLQSISNGSLKAYWPVWRDLTRWSLAGLVLTEATVNAHAYFVTFWSGPGIFALLAVGTLAMRPASLILSALPDRERPVMARAMAAEDWKSAWRSMVEFRIAVFAVWAAACGFAAALLFLFPEILQKAEFRWNDVAIVVAFWAVIMAARAGYAAEAVFLQAAGEFKTLAAISTRTSIVAVIVTPILLYFAGPIASLGGILAGDIVCVILVAQAVYRVKKAKLIA